MLLKCSAILYWQGSLINIHLDDSLTVLLLVIVFQIAVCFHKAVHVNDVMLVCVSFCLLNLACEQHIYSKIS